MGDEGEWLYAGINVTMSRRVEGLTSTLEELESDRGEEEVGKVIL